MTPAENFVDFKNVWLAYNEALLAQNHFAVEDINLQVREGEFLVLVGPSGCGKSTLLGLLAGLEQVDEGAIQLDGADVASPGRDRLVMFQQDALLPWKTVLENIALGLDFRGIGRTQARDAARGWLKRAGLEGFGDRASLVAELRRRTLGLAQPRPR